MWSARNARRTPVVRSRTAAAVSNLMHAANGVFAELNPNRQKKLRVAGNRQGLLLQTRTREIAGRLIGDLRAANGTRPGENAPHARPDGRMLDQERQQVGRAFAVANHEDVAGGFALRGYFASIGVQPLTFVECAEQVSHVGFTTARGCASARNTRMAKRCWMRGSCF
mgnify:CR=1 FL=1